jgi:hypothetical protein
MRLHSPTESDEDIPGTDLFTIDPTTALRRSESFPEHCLSLDKP